MNPGTSPSFGALKQVDAGVLSVGYAEAGPADGQAVMLLHGWPRKPRRPSPRPSSTSTASDLIRRQ
jgi:hypothetical protein